MTASLVRQAIHAFLETSTPQVLCIRGKWGVGKTFVWNDAFKEAKAKSAIALPYYCYVSLFGLQSIDEVRQTIFENRVPTTRLEIEPTFESLTANVKHYGEVISKQLSRVSSYAKVPYLDKYIANVSGGFRQIVSLAVRDTIICFDDFERKKLSARDLLGLVSQFREQKRCKAVILLNEDALTADEKAEFNRYFEKVVDIPIEFAPSTGECAEIAVKGDDATSQKIRANAITLGISNIRIIQRVKEVSRDLLRILAPFDEQTKHQAVHTLTLLIWSKYGDGTVPMNFIAGRAHDFSRFMDGENKTDEEKMWDSTLEAYQFNHCDQLDLLIMEGVERGFFDEGKIVAEAKQQDERLANSASQMALERAWRPLHDSFDNDATQVVEAVYSAYTKYMKVVSRGHLDQTVSIFRKLGYTDKASDLINAYVEQHKQNIVAVDQPNDPFHPIVQDSEFRTALATVAVPPSPMPVKDALIELGKGRLTQGTTDAALNVSIDEFYEMFRKLHGDERDSVIAGALFWRNVGNATTVQKDSAKRAWTALERIGNESPLNAIRVKKYGVIVETAEVAEAGGAAADKANGNVSDGDLP